METSTNGSYRQRRERLLETCGDGPILVRGMLDGGGPHTNLFYLTGLEEPRAALLMAREGLRIETGARYPGPHYVRGRMVRQILFLPASDPLAKRWGEDSAATLESLSAEQAGVDAVLPLGELEPLLERSLSQLPRLHYVRGAPARLSGEPDADSRFVARLRERFFGLEVQDATPAVHEARRAKSDAEVQGIERALALTAEALDTVLRKLAPGVSERELAAEITRVYGGQGAVHAFDPIVAAGANALSLHYVKNSGRLEAGQLLLVDTGASLHGYKSDITRTYPVDGKFTPRQREVYQTVLRAQQEAIAACRPGALLADVHATAFRIIDDAGFGDSFIHGTSHHLGLETHDVGDVHRPLEPGAVITVEPGIYLTEEQIGIRIEDDVLVTGDGPRVLGPGIASSVEEIEERIS
jgi:Xaa-Pro aminopeptidase